MVQSLNYLIVTTDDQGRVVAPYTAETSELVALIIQKMNLNLICDDWISDKIKPRLAVDPTMPTPTDPIHNVGFDFTAIDKYDYVIELRVADVEIISANYFSLDPSEDWIMTCNKYALDDCEVEVIEWRREYVFDPQEMPVFEIECEDEV